MSTAIQLMRLSGLCCVAAFLALVATLSLGTMSPAAA
jgi:hypothetical protein